MSTRSTVELSDQLLAAAKAEERETLLTVKEYAARYGLHIQTVYSSIRRGLFPHRIERPTSRAIRIIVSRGSIHKLKSA
jgi:predicted DNA-binding transcriptional regulator AlpA